MPVVAKPIWDTTESAPLPVYRFTVAQYHHMIQAGILTEDDRAELLDGWIVATFPCSPPHATVSCIARERFSAYLPPGWFIRERGAITTEESEPEADLAIVRGPVRRYFQSHPGPADVALVMEISDAVHALNRQFKLQVYARARIPVCWIVDLVETQIRVFTKPTRGKTSPAYAQCRAYGRDESAPLMVDGHKLGSIAVRELLP
jgi:hypothetical protein